MKKSMGIKTNVQTEGMFPQTQASEIEKLVQQYKTFKLRCLDLDKQYEAEKKALMESSGRSEDDVEKIVSQRKSVAMEGLVSEFAMKDDTYTELMNQITKMSTEQLQKALSAATDQLKKLEANGGDPLQIAVAKAKVDAAKGQLKDTEGTSDKDMTKTIEGYNNCKLAVDDVITEMGFLDKATQDVLKSANNIAGGTIDMIKGIESLSSVAGKSMSALEKSTVILAIAAGAMKIFTAVFNLSDTRAEKKIKSYQKGIDELQGSYRELGVTLNETFSDAMFLSMDGQVANLEEQKRLINKQKGLEESKKKTDNSKVKQYENSISDIDAKIAENQKKQIELFAGTSVQNAIDKFADSLVAAYGKGETAAQALGKTTKDVLSKAVKDSLKRQFLGDGINNAVKYLSESMESDGKLTSKEQDEFKRQVELAGTSFYNAMATYDELFKGTDIAPKDSTQTTSGQLQASMTEGTASALVGLWNSSSLDIRRLKEIAETQRTEPVPVEIYNPESNELQTLQGLTDEQLQQARSGADSVRELLSQSMLIEQNTRRTADNTGTIITELQSGFGKLEGQLTSIERNTKGSKSRA